MVKREHKRILILADQHVGHRAGLTPPRYWSKLGGDRYYEMQKQGWGWYEAAVKKLRPIDYLILNGDAVDGEQRRAGGSELIIPDRNQQIEAFIESIKPCDVPPENTLMTHGTGYHTSNDGQDQETIIANVIGCQIKSHIQFAIKNWEKSPIIDIRHAPAGRSAVPNTRANPVMREWLSNLLWAEHGVQEKADIIIRSHVHYHVGITQPSRRGSWWGITTPALQQAATKYGARTLSNVVHFGLVWVDCYKDGRFIWDSNIVWVEAVKSKLLRL